MFYAALMLQTIPEAALDAVISLTAQGTPTYQRQFDLLAEDMRTWIEEKRRILLLMGDGEKAASMKEMLAARRLPAVAVPNPDDLPQGVAMVAEGALERGFVLPEAHLTVLTEKDIFGHQKKKLRPPTSPSGAKIAHFREIQAGDYVVHVNHGIGKYLGVVTLDVGGVKRDYLHIQYGGDDKIFVSTDQVQLLQKYKIGRAHV